MIRQVDLLSTSWQLRRAFVLLSLFVSNLSVLEGSKFGALEVSSQ